jgi:O-antigen/teichoic acid export membrane protein
MTVEDPSTPGLDESWRSGRAFFRSIGLNFFGQIAILALGVVPSILVARWLGPADRGLLGIMLTAKGLVLGIASVGIPTAVWYYSSRRDAKHAELLGNSVVYAAALTIVLVPTVWYLSGPIGDLLARGRGGHVWVLAAALVPVTLLDWSAHNQLLGQLRFGFYNVLITTARVVFLVGAVVLIGVFDTGVAGFFIATAAGSTLVIVGSTAVITRWGLPRVDLKLFRAMLAYGSKVQVGGVFQLFNARFDVVILQFFRPLSAVGYYVIAQMLAELVMVLARAFQSSILPLVSYESGDPTHQATTTVRSMRHHAILAAGAMAANAVFAPLLIVVGFGNAFYPAFLPFFIILPGIWFLGSALVVSNDLSGRGRPGLASALTGLAVTITIGLDLLLIPPFGVPGAAVASLVAYTVFGVASLIALSRVSAIPVRDLLPTRAELALYPAASRVVLARVQAFLADLSPLSR